MARMRAKERPGNAIFWLASWSLERSKIDSRMTQEFNFS